MTKPTETKDQTNKNMELWSKVEKSNPLYVKKVTLGKREFHAVAAQSQIMKATELWGPVGDKWGICEENFRLIEAGEENKHILYQGVLIYPSGELPIHSSIKAGLPDWAKKVATDALTKGLSKLGFNADIFMGMWDDNKYVAEMRRQWKTDQKEIEGHTGERVTELERELGEASGDEQIVPPDMPEPPWEAESREVK